VSVGAVVVVVVIGVVVVVRARVLTQVTRLLDFTRSE
jgi:uncharacterized membrane protein